jgi:hypothetical protein
MHTELASQYSPGQFLLGLLWLIMESTLMLPSEKPPLEALLLRLPGMPAPIGWCVGSVGLVAL